MEENILVYVVKYPDRKNYMMRYKCPVSGKQIARSTGTHRKREAERIAAKWESELQDGRYSKPSMMSWSDFRDKYEQEVLPGLKKSTEQKTICILNAVERILKPNQVRDITPDRLSTYVAAMRRKKRADSTIAGHLAHFHAALTYAVEWKIISQVPELPRLKRVKRSKTMKGRPITVEEHERMLTATAKIVGDEAAPSWQRFQRGLWASGLRLDESLHLYWDRNDCPEGDDCLEVRLDGRKSLLIIPAELEKGNQDRELPMAPEFAEFLEQTPIDQRAGLAFNLRSPKARNTGPIKSGWASEIISDIGKAARVVVSRKGRKTKFASAHDLRRSFGQRWASEVMPQILMELMRHKDIATTLKYYVGADARATANILWDVAEKRARDLGNILGNTQKPATKKHLKK